MKKNTSKAYTLAELVVVVMFVGIMAAIAIPRINFAIIRKSKAGTTVGIIAAGLRRTRVLAISDAAGNTNGYELNMTGGSPYSGYEIENMNTSAIIDSYTFDPAIAVTNGSDFEFGPLGSLKSADTQIDVAAGGRSYTITIVSATGMVKWVQN
jgi:Tfp pilus assembly protein FimT